MGPKLLVISLGVSVFFAAFSAWYVFLFLSPRLSPCLSKSSVSPDAAILFGTVIDSEVRGQDYIVTIAPCTAKQSWPVSKFRFIVPVRGIGVVRAQGQGAGRTYVFGSAAPEQLLTRQTSVAVRLSQNPLRVCDDAWCNSQKSFLAARGLAQQRLVTAIAKRNILEIVLTLVFTPGEFIASDFAEVPSQEEFSQIIQDNML